MCILPESRWFTPRLKQISITMILNDWVMTQYYSFFIIIDHSDRQIFPFSACVVDSSREYLESS
jgi:hypothetical protein